MSDKREALHNFYRHKLDTAIGAEFESAKRDLAIIEQFLLEGYADIDFDYLASLLTDFKNANHAPA